MPIIEARDLAKEFRRPKQFDGHLGGLRTLFTRQHTTTHAVDGVSFDIQEGELVGYLGPNGAGKSTTIKMLTGILVPTSGTIHVNGLVPWADRKRNARQIGVVFGQKTQLWWDLPLRDSLQVIGKLYDLSSAKYQEQVEQFTELLGLGDFLDKPVRQLSLGQRMRGDLAAAMLYEPPILYLDEPTIGLDVVAKERMRSFVATMNREQKTTVILTTHDLDDVEQLCSRIILIDHGAVLYDGDVGTLKKRFAPYRELVVTSQHSVDVPTAETVRTEDGKTWLRFDPEHTPVADVIGAVLAEHEVSDLAIIEPELEGVIRQIYETRN